MLLFLQMERVDVVETELVRAPQVKSRTSSGAWWLAAVSREDLAPDVDQTDVALADDAVDRLRLERAGADVPAGLRHVHVQVLERGRDEVLVGAPTGVAQVRLVVVRVLPVGHLAAEARVGPLGLATSGHEYRHTVFSLFSVKSDSD